MAETARTSTKSYVSVRDEVMVAVLAGWNFDNERFNDDVEDWNTWMTMAARDDHRGGEIARGRILEEQDRQIEAKQRDLENWNVRL